MTDLDHIEELLNDNNEPANLLRQIGRGLVAVGRRLDYIIAVEYAPKAQAARNANVPPTAAPAAAEVPPPSEASEQPSFTRVEGSTEEHDEEHLEFTHK